MENTPGSCGYLIAWAVSVALFSAAGTVGQLLDGGDVFSPIYVLVMNGFFTAMFSVPFACVGIALVHFACRRVAAQSVHVVAAGLAGTLPALLLVAPGDKGFLTALCAVSVATAIGRWSVVPLVWWRRRAGVRPVARAAG